MYQDHKKAQCFKGLKRIIVGKKETLCLICLKPLGNRLSFRSLALKPVICEDCLSHFMRSDFMKTVNGIKVTALYRRNDFIEQLYRRYAKMYDYALKDAFIIPAQRELRVYRSYKIVTLADDEKISRERLYDADLCIAQGIGESCLAIRDSCISSGDALKDTSVLFFTARFLSFEQMFTAFTIIQSYQPSLIEGLMLLD